MNIGADADALHPVGLIKGRRIGSADGRGKLEHARMSEKLANGVLWDAGAVFALPEKGLRNLIHHDVDCELADVAKGETLAALREDEYPGTGEGEKYCQSKDCLLGGAAKISGSDPGGREEDKSNGEIERLGQIGKSKSESQEGEGPAAAARDGNSQDQ